MEDTKRVRISRLIAVPAVITLLVTILRLVGELQHWPRPWFSNEAGGGAALVGISWLPIIFGPYFALKLAKTGSEWSSAGKAWGMTAIGFLVFVVGAVVVGMTLKHPNVVTLAGFVLQLVAAFIPGVGWSSLGKTLLAYAFAARIPILIVMFFAMRGNGGAGWGTHYDVVPPGFPSTHFLAKYIYLAFLPQMTLWIAWTVIAGALFGLIATAIVRPGRRAAPAPATN